MNESFNIQSISSRNRHFNIGWGETFGSPLATESGPKKPKTHHRMAQWWVLLLLRPLKTWGGYPVMLRIWEFHKL